MQTTQLLTAQRAVRRDLAALGVAGLAVGLLLVAVVFLVGRAIVPADGAAGAYVTTGWTASGMEVGSVVDPEGPLQPGDIVTSVNGVSMDAWVGGLFDPALDRPALHDGGTLRYGILRDGAPGEVSVTLAPFPVGAMLLASWGTVLWVALMLIVAGYLFARRPAQHAARALLIASAAIAGSALPWMLGIGPSAVVAGPVVPTSYLIATFPLYLLFWSGVLHFGAVFPRPLFSGHRQRNLVIAIYVLPMAIQGAWMVGTLPGSDGPLAWIGGWTVIQLALVPAILISGIALAIAQWRTSGSEGQLRMRWIIGAGALSSAIVLAGWYLPNALIGSSILPWSAVGLAGLPFPLAIGLAVRRGRLFGIETVLQRSLVYGALTAGVVLVYAASAVLVSSLLPGDGPYAVQLLAAGAAALLALPLRDRLQRGVSHLLYGDRDDPYKAVARLSERLEATLEPEAVLPMVAETVAQALRLPYAAIELGRNGDTVVAAAHGTPRDAVERLPLSHQGEEIGWLVAARRAPDEPFSPADEALLASMARQAGAAAYAVRLTADLRRSRQQLVSAREEERRRLRRDLHDGLGPALAGSLLKIEAARARGGEMDPLLDELASETRRTIEDVRRLAYELRPPVLDQLGLVGALAQDANRLRGGGIEVTVAADEPMPELAAAVEVAAYRIGSEALTNIAHHAAAERAWLDLHIDGDALVVEVRDDGTGIEASPHAGVGLSSMRERAEELGGQLEVGAASEGGLRITGRIPLPVELGHA